MLIKFHKTSNKKIINALLIFFTAFIGGYTVSKFPKEFLDLFATPLGQYISFFCILYMYYQDDKNITLKEIILESALYVIILQCITKLLHLIYK